MGHVDRENELIDEHFTDWGAAGRPGTPERRREFVLSWLGSQTRSVNGVAMILLARVQGILAELQADVPLDERSRFFARVDSDHLVKEPASILEKMARKWEAAGPPPIGFRDVLTAIHDLGRLRIVANFLSDAAVVRRALEVPYDARQQPNLTQAQRGLAKDFRLQGNALEDHIHVNPRRRQTGERCYKGHFELTSRKEPTIEVQIVTGLAEAWDKKDHFLIYEPRRRGVTIDLQDEIEIYAYSETLYLADVFFDRLKKKVVGGRDATKK